MPMRHKNWL